MGRQLRAATMAAGSGPESGRLVVTLVRGLAGKKELFKATCKALGVTKTWRSKEAPNNDAIRGMIHQVRHLVRVELKEAHDARLAEAALRKSPRPPITVRHSDVQ